MRHRLALAVLLAMALLLLLQPGRAVGDGATPPDRGEYPRWQWPVEAPQEVVEPYRAPAHRYAAGHRGVDLRAQIGSEVRAPAVGVVAFRGVVVDRPVLTIEHGGGLVSSYEPLMSHIAVGTVVSVGDLIGTVGVGGHAAANSLHVGVRVRGEYVNPMLLFGSVPRAVLLPCCHDG
ncbi:M23 family metallopeptidase [Microbacterium sp. LS_15]|uniref:murein hydrolase activator EnvC family protein n=1 Tax=Microbacterium sp. LS_15 TaxID=3055790 RepID=UPI0035BEECA5